MYKQNAPIAKLVITGLGTSTSVASHSSCQKKIRKLKKKSNIETLEHTLDEVEEEEDIIFIL